MGLDVVGLGLAKADAARRYLPTAEPGTLLTSPDGGSKAGLWMPVTRSLRPPTKVITRFPSGHGWTGGADDTSVTLFTDRSYKVTTNGTNASQYATSPTFGTPVDASSSVFRLYVQAADPTKLQFLTLYVTMGAGNVCSFQLNGANGNLIAGEWAVLTVARSMFTVNAGTPNWANVTQVQTFSKDTSTVTNYWVGGIELIPDQATTYPNGVFILEADDGYSGQKNLLAPVTGQRGIPVTMNVIADRFLGVAASGMTPASLRTYQHKWGWQVSCHAYGQTVHDTANGTVGSLEQDFQRQKHWLRANGLHSGVDHYALCPGTGSPVAEGALMEALRRSFRSVRVNTGTFETATPADPTKLRSLLFGGTGSTVANMQATIDKAAAAGGALIYTVHDVIAGSTDNLGASPPQQAVTNLTTVLDYAIGKGMAFRTRADYLDGR